MGVTDGCLGDVLTCSMGRTKKNPPECRERKKHQPVEKVTALLQTDPFGMREVVPELGVHEQR